MKKLFVLTILFLSSVQIAHAKKIAGKYELVGDLNDLRRVKKVELVEYFNFSCGHCYRFLETSKQLENKYKDKLTHKSVPIFWGKQTPYPTMAYYIAQDKGMGETAKKEIFDARFKMGVDVFDYRMISFLTSSLGFGEEFAKKSQSPQMKARIDKSQAEANQMGATQTPTIILNGVIRVNPGMTGGDTDKMTENLDVIIGDILN